MRDLASRETNADNSAIVDIRMPIVGCIAALLLSCASLSEAGTAAGSTANRVLGFIPYVRDNPCTEPYRQIAVSPPLKSTSDGGEGFPWRVLYGYCVAQSGRFSVHQDWVASYLDAEPQGDAPGGTGVSLGSDFSMQWKHRHGDRFSLYYELGAGIQYAAGTPFPAHGSRWMFTINAGAGFLIPLRTALMLNTAIRYLHISNAGLVSDNAGYDAFHLVIGVRW